MQRWKLTKQTAPKSTRRIRAVGPSLAFASCFLFICFANFSDHAWAQNAISSAAATLPRVEFAIESSLFVGNDRAPKTRNLTLFSEGVVYDFPLTGPTGEAYNEVVIYDSKSKTTTLVDMNRKIRLDLHQVQVIRILDSVRKEAQQDERTRFLVEDHYEEVIDADERTISLTSDNLTYHVQGAKPHEDHILPIYFEFLSAFTKLNVTDPSKILPFPRLRLNSTIRRIGWMPMRVDIKVAKNAMFKTPFEAHSKHQVIERLDPNHRAMIQEAKGYWMAYKGVDLATYRGFKSDPKWKQMIRTASSENRE